MLNFETIKENEFRLNYFMNEYYVTFDEDIELKFDFYKDLVVTEDGFNHDLRDSIEQTFELKTFVNIYGDFEEDKDYSDLIEFIKEKKQIALSKYKRFEREVLNVCKYLNYDLD